MPGALARGGSPSFISHQEIMDRLAFVEFQGQAVLDARAYGLHEDETNNLSAINATIAEAHSRGGNVAVYIPSGSYHINGVLDPIQQSRIRVTGEGESSRIIQDGAHGTFFTLNARWCSVDRLYLDCTDVVSPPTEHTFIVNAPDCRLQDVRCAEVAGILKQGGVVGEGAARLFAFNLQGTIQETGTTANWWDISQAAGSRWLFNHFTGGLIGDAGAYWKILGAIDGSTDGFWIVGNTCFSNPGPGGTLGKQYAYFFDATAGAINNGRIIANGSDGSHSNAIRARLNSDIDNCRNWIFTHNRMETAGGEVIDFTDTSTTHTSECFTFSNNTFFCGNDNGTTPPFTFTAPAARGINLSHNQIKKNGTGNTVSFIRWSCDDFVCEGNIINEASGATVPDYLYRTTADVNDYRVIGNSTLTPTIAEFNHFAYASPSAKRVVLLKNIYEPKRVVHEAGGRFTAAGAAATIYLLSYGLSDQTAVAATSAAGSNSVLYYFHAPNHAVSGLDTKLAVRATIATAAAPTINVTVGLYPVVNTAGNLVPGTVLSGSTNVFNAPAANSFTTGVSGTVAAPANGVYVLGYTVSGAPAAAAVIQAQILVWNEA